MRKPPSDDHPRAPRSRRSNRPPRSRARAVAPTSWFDRIRHVVLVAAGKTIAKHGPGIVHSPDSLLIYRLIAFFLISVIGGVVRFVLGPPRPPTPAPTPRMRGANRTLPPARTAKRSRKKKKPNDTR